MQDIPQYKTFTKIEPVFKGWSYDRKYYVETTEGDQWLLRITDITQFERKKAEFAMMQAVAAQGVPMSKPIDFGLCEGGKSVYILLTWQNGREATEVIPGLAPQQQYELGRQAGVMLAKMHLIPAPAGQEDWEARFNRKIDRNIAKYSTCGVQIPGDEKILAYISHNRHLLANRPQTFQHGDYHVGNMIISDSVELSIIDFNRFDFGDPWEEFNRIVWCAECSRYFASARIGSYFHGDVPERFFRLLTLYICSNTLSSIYWAIPFGPAEVSKMLHQARQVLDDFDEMNQTVPRWYIAGAADR